MQATLSHNEINPDHWNVTGINTLVNQLVYWVKSLTGFLGLVVLSPLLVLILVIAYLYLVFKINKALKQFKIIHSQMRYFLSDECPDKEIGINRTHESRLMLLQAKNTLLNDMEDRPETYDFVMSLLQKQENKIIEAIEEIENEVRPVLFPNHSKKFSQEELETMLERSQGVPDLDDPEMDALMERYA